MEPIIEWSSPEHNFARKSTDWYWILGAITFCITVVSFYFHNIIFGIFALLAGIIVGMLSYRETPIVPITVQQFGITVGRNLYPFKSLESFWLEDDHVHGPHIFLKSTNSFRPLITIPINEEVDLGSLQEILSNFLDEEYLQESILHRWFDKVLK